MRLLLDTHIALWAVTGNKRLSVNASRLIDDTTNGKYVSAASIWEIAIKFALRREHPGDMPMSAGDAKIEFDLANFRSLEVTDAHAAAVETLPLLHGDPFDRLLIAQALTEPLRLLTADTRLADYGAIILMV